MEYSAPKVAAFVASFVAAVLDLPQQIQKGFLAALERWHAASERVAADPTAVVGMSVCGGLGRDEAMQMASELVTGIDRWYICRNGNANNSGRKCGYFSLASNWACTDETYMSGHYRCPSCGQLYQPWTDKGSRLPFNMIMTVNTEGKSADELKAMFGISAETVSEKGVCFIPFLWANTAEQSLMNVFAELMLQLGNNMAEVPVCKLPQAIAARAMEGQVKRTFWTDFTITPEARAEIDKVNESSTKVKFHYKKLLEPFPAARYEWDGCEIWSQQQLAESWGTARLALRAALAGK